MVNPDGNIDLTNSAEELEERTRDESEESILLGPVVDPRNPEQGPEQDADKSTVAKSSTEFQSLTKEQLQVFVKNPFWRRLRLIVFILFWVVWVAMLAAVIIIIAVSPKCPPRPARQFWQKPFYRLQVKSFAPMGGADPSAAGSIEGLAKKMDYLRQTLGFTNFLLDSLVSSNTPTGCPADFKTISSSLGSLEALKALTKHGRKKGFNFLMVFDASQVDINWQRSTDGGDVFVSLANATGESRLASRNDGPAWRKNRLHLPSNSCPSLNITSPTVLARVEEALAFWLEAGLAGFVLTNVAFMSPSTQVVGNVSSGRWFDADPTSRLFSNDSVRFVRSVRRFLNEQAEKRGQELALFVDPGNTGFPQPEARLAAYLDPAGGAHAIVSTSLGTPLSPLVLKEPRLPLQVIQDTLTAVGDSGSVMFATAWPSLRRPGESYWTALSLILPGVPCLYYGQELGMTHVAGVRLIGSGLTSYLAGNDSTDASETPMQWADSPANAGWLANDTTPLAWCDLTRRAADVERRNLRLLSSSGHPTSELQLVQALVKLIATKESLQWGRLTFLPTGAAASGDVIAFKRQAERFPPVVVVVNSASQATSLDLSDAGSFKATLKVLHSWDPSASAAASTYEVEKDYSLSPVFAPSKSILVFLGKEAE